MTTPDLSRILVPSLYDQILKIQFPWEGSVDIAFASQYYFQGEPDSSHQVYNAVHHQALKPLSAFCPTCPDLSKYLPEPLDPRYPEHTLALVLLLDQAPRMLYKAGTDVRWVGDFFDVATKKLVKELISRNALPDALDRWIALGHSFEDAMIRRFWLYTPLIHSEDLSDHQIAAEKIDEMRRDVEKYTGSRDPYRDTHKEDAKDTTLFAKLIREGPPSTSPEFFFWMFRVFDAHDPIIEAYGRYPYRNEALGRETTEAEAEYLKSTNDFGKPRLTESEVQKIKKQKREGMWEELSDKGPW